MLEKLQQIWKAKDLRNNIIFVLLMLVIFRLAAHVPIPGVNVQNLREFFAQNQILGLLNVFSGGGLSNFSIIMLGVGPYITASIIFQLLAMIVPSLEAMSKEEAGQHKINQYTRIITVPLAALSGYGFITLLQRQGNNLITTLTTSQWISALITVIAGTIFLMWLGELISEKKVGNGISLLIFAGIVSRLPSSFQQTLATFDASQFLNLLVFIAIALVTITVVVIITEAQRNIPVNYAKQIRGNRMYGGVSSHLPLRVNMAGVIPIIFAISIILFPPMVGQFFVNASTAWIAGTARFVINLFQNQLFYGIIYFVLVFAFTYFYTYVIFHPFQISENLQKQGGFIPGIRPGRHTADYLQITVNKILLAGALFLSVVAVLPIIMQSITGTGSLVIGGTSLLIVVSVVIETVKQVDSQLTMRDYEGL
ncbi:MAG: preprotein translocase subunit SecY [Candidatus Komeilibacteria bacterium]|nr:preprotein translocase subunit SecY [Candidatus Komeilibacteria bacterium]